MVGMTFEGLGTIKGTIGGGLDTVGGTIGGALDIVRGIVGEGLGTIRGTIGGRLGTFGGMVIYVDGVGVGSVEGGCTDIVIAGTFISRCSTLAMKFDINSLKCASICAFILIFYSFNLAFVSAFLLAKPSVSWPRCLHPYRPRPFAILPLI